MKLHSKKICKCGNHSMKSTRLSHLQIASFKFAHFYSFFSSGNVRYMSFKITFMSYLKWHVSYSKPLWAQRNPVPFLLSSLSFFFRQFFQFILTKPPLEHLEHPPLPRASLFYREYYFIFRRIFKYGRERIENLLENIF